MKIISWNCRGKFRDKYSLIKLYNAEIYVIQECENPQKQPTILSEFYSNYFWYGENDSKGLGIFAKPEIQMIKNDWPTYCLRHFLSVRINGTFDLLGVWASAPYIEEYYIYQAINIDKYTENTVLIGDFNSNTIWDKKHGNRNHSAVVRELNEKELVSAYHFVTGEKTGCETQNTYFMYKHPEKKYHIDYCFLKQDNIVDFQIFDYKKWLKYSDHIPIQVVIK